MADLSQAEINRLIERVRWTARQMPGTEPDAEIEVRFVEDAERLAASHSGGLIRVKTGIDDEETQTRLVLHEVAHQLVPDGSYEGHNQIWGDLFAASAAPELGVDSVAEYLDAYDEFENVDTEQAVAFARRQSSGGSVMDPRIEEAVRKLTDAGFTQEEALQTLSSFTQYEELPPGDLPLLDKLVEDEIRLHGSGPMAGPPGSPASAGKAPTEREQEEALIREGLERQQDPNRAPTEEQQAALDDPANEDIYLEALEDMKEDPYNWNWVYNDPDTQILPGALDNDVAMSELLLSFEALGVIDEADYIDLSEEDRVKLVKETLTRNRNSELVKWAVIDWGREKDVYTPEMTIDGVNTRDVVALMGRGLPQSRAESWGRIAKGADVDPTKLYDIWSGSEKRQTLATSQPQGALRSAKRSPYEVAREYKEGLERYEGSDTLASIHVSDPELAKKLKGDPYSLDSGELRRALDMLGGEEGTAESGDPQVNWLKERLAGGFQATANVQSQEDVESALNTLASAWNMTGAEDVVAKVSQQLVSQAVASARAQLPNPFGGVDNSVQVTERGSPQALVESELRQTDEYEELFGDLSPGESEQEYANRFDRATQSVLGDDVASVSRNAMRSGNVNTAYQQGLLTDAGEGSTRFQEILAKNSQIFQEML